MRKNAPHLPPKSCRVDTYYRLQNIKWILLFALLAFVAGISAALIAVTWVIPQYDTVGVVNNFNNHAVSYNTPDPFLIKQSEQRMFTIYDKRKKTEEKVYSEESFVGKAVIISSDGWSATYIPDYFFGWEKNWEVIDYQNNIFSVKKVVYDNFSGVLYLKVDTQGARVVSFPNSNKIQIGSFVWSISANKWQDDYVKDNNKIKNDKSFYIWNDQYYYSLANSNQGGNILLDEQGNLLGFLDVTGLVVPSWIVEKQTNNLLSVGVLDYKNINWKGHMVQVNRENGVILSGFYLDYVGDKNGDLKVGDIIFKVNEHNVKAEDISEYVWLCPDEFQVVVLRGDEELVFNVNKEKISL